MELTLAHSRSLIRQIQAVDPNYRFDSLGVPETVQGQINQLQELRVDRAVAFYRIEGKTAALQVEALRFLQRRVDARYEEALSHLKEGRITPKLSTQEALGNYIDATVRSDLRKLYNGIGISMEKGQNVQVNRRAHNTPEGSYTVPDSKVGNVAFDVSLTAKTARTLQVQKFFRSDFQPVAVVIVRPSQLGPNSTYLITKPTGN